MESHNLSPVGFAWILAANMATSGFPLLIIGNADLILAHGNTEMIERYVRPMLEGHFYGKMYLSEPHAGSSLAKIPPRTVPQADGSYRIFGSKMWISFGEHEVGENIIHLVAGLLHRGKCPVEPCFFRWELPKAETQLTAFDVTTLAMAGSWF